MICAIVLFWICFTARGSLFVMITPPTLPGTSVNNYDPAGFEDADRVRLTTALAGSAITGLAAQNDGDVRFLQNMGPGPLTLTNEDSGSTDVNRFKLPGALSLTLSPMTAAQCVYDVGLARWLLLSSTASTVALADPPAITTVPIASNTIVNDYAPVDATTGDGIDKAKIVNIPTASGGAATFVTITGLIAGYLGQIVTLVNRGTASKILLKHNSSSSQAPNRLLLPGSVDMPIQRHGAVTLRYIGTGWELIGAGFSGLFSAGQNAGQVTGTIHNWALSSLNNFDRSVVTPITPTTVTGIIAQYDGCVITLQNTSSNIANTLTFNHLDVGSQAQNRIFCPGLAAYVVPAGGAVTLCYDGVAAVWRFLAAR